ncbi:putative baseplate assembly protein (plasmid) [Streptomyces cadmiisoli]|uniref:Putative baseplate assembly protein n=2 Tax=Streptomyces cadmiisoli TaxID=2184053 RepID=A0A2Z4JEQ1_9ACTN|nr:putative baseplate assembly protein [Streptomyces cadmiisoli]
MDEARRLIARRCPEWTDHNPSEPGSTLLEAFAMMADQIIHRLNQVPDRLYVKFLDLIGLRMVPPAPARTPVTFWSTSAVTEAPLVVRGGTRVGTLRTETEEAVTFGTDHDASMVPGRLTHVLTHGPDDDGPLDREFGPQGVRVPFAAFGAPPRHGDALLLGLEKAVPGCAVRVGFDGRIDGVGVDPGAPPLVWEAWDGSVWSGCDVSTDGTGGLNRAGDIVVHVPEAHDTAVLGGRTAAWLRARVVEPADGLPGYTSSPVVHGLSTVTVGVTVTATNVEVVDREYLDDAEGVPGQRFAVPRGPVLAPYGEPVLEIAPRGDDTEWETWTRVDDFAGSGPRDRHFVLDAMAREVHLGPAVREPDGTLRRYGAVPPDGAAVRLRRFAVGGGARGNVAAGAVRSLLSSLPFVAGVENRAPGRGGADGETLAEAVARAPLMLRSSSRAVTAEDFESLAQQAAPELARVRLMPDGEPGAVRLLVVPAAPAGERVRLEHLVPARKTLDRVAARLDEVRLVGTRVMIEPPLYRGVTVVCRMTAHHRATGDRVRKDAEEALYRFLDPLPGGGPNGTGWPFGRPVQVGEIFALLQRVPGVDLVDDVRLFAANPVTGERGQESRRIDLPPNSLVVSYDHHIRVEERR